MGTSNKYQIKKAQKIENKKEVLKPIMREIEKNNNTKSSLNITEQKNNLLKLINKNYDSITLLIEKQIKKKISSYKNQDIIKKIYDSEKIITFEEIIEIMNKENIKCYYCHYDMFILYELSRENKQWTLDRINNDIGHNKDNIVLSCLECNLQKRKKQKEAFLFTKNLKVIQSNENYENLI